jgi:SAM-dependent methyltransferase
MDILDERFKLLAECPACGGSSLGPWKKGNIDPGLLGPEAVKITDSRYGATWDMSLCLSCGHIFANPCPTSSLLDTIYAAVEDPLYDEEAEGRSRNFERILRCLEKKAPAKGLLCDVGAATGILLRLARNRGWEADGVEPSSWAVDYALRKYGLTLRRGTFESADLEPGRYSAVTMVDFIEHSAEPFTALAKANEILKSGGLVCLVTPDIHSLAAKLARGSWWHFRAGHIAFFSRRSLEALLRRSGFFVEKIRGYSWTFSAHYLASRKKTFAILLRRPNIASFLKKIPIKLTLGDSFEVYARKVELR